MAARETQFSPATQARIDRKAERAASFRAAAADALDVGRGWTGPGKGYDPVFDSGTDLSLGLSKAAVEQGRPLRPHERRGKRRELLDQQAGQRAAQQAKAKKLSVDEWLERMSPQARAEVELTEKFQNLSEQAQAYVLRRRSALEEVLEEADYRVAVEDEETAFAGYEDEDVSPPWLPQDREPTDEEQEAWDGYLATAEPEAPIDWEAVTDPNAEPVYSDNIEDGYEEDE
jgi:hypothetical protein